MAKLTIVLNVPDDRDPRLIDPHELADDIIEAYNDEQRRNGGGDAVSLDIAAWEGGD